MRTIKQTKRWNIYRNARRGAVVLFSAGIFILSILTAQAQTYRVIYNFTGQQDGAYPLGNVAIDRSGNVYGTAYSYGAHGAGTVFRLQPKNSSWLFTPLYAFTGGADGGYPSGATIGPDGSVYGGTWYGGILSCSCGGIGCGVVFNVKPPPTRPRTAVVLWNERVLHVFNNAVDGCEAGTTVSFDTSGKLYGVTLMGGTFSAGTAYQLTRAGSGWTENTLHHFGGNDGGEPLGPLAFDAAGNLYGVSQFGGASGHGTVFQLTPSGSGWSLNVLTSFPQSSDGNLPKSGVIVDQAGNVFGATSYRGSGSGGTVFSLSPGAWTLSVLYNFTDVGGGPQYAPLSMDAAGNLYGVTTSDGTHQYGNIFKMTPSDGGWIYSDLYDFTGGADGGYPSSNLVFDAMGNLYGTANVGGTGSNCEFDCGVVFEITP